MIRASSRFHQFPEVGREELLVAEILHSDPIYSLCEFAKKISIYGLKILNLHQSIVGAACVYVLEVVVVYSFAGAPNAHGWEPDVVRLEAAGIDGFEAIFQSSKVVCAHIVCAEGELYPTSLGPYYDVEARNAVTGVDFQRHVIFLKHVQNLVYALRSPQLFVILLHRIRKISRVRIEICRLVRENLHCLVHDVVHVQIGRAHV